MSSDQLSDDEENRLWKHKYFGMNVVKTPPVDRAIGQMPADFAHLAMGPPEQMIRMPDLPNGEAFWISRDALRHCVIMSDQTWVARLHSAAPRPQDILQDTAPINWWNVYFETDSERRAASDTTGAAIPGILTTQGRQASSVQQATGLQLPAFGTLSASTNQGHQFRPPSISQSQTPTTSGRTSAQGGFNTQNAADFLGNGSAPRTNSATQVPAAGPQNGSFIGGYGNVITRPPVSLQYGAPYQAWRGQTQYGSIVDGGRNVAGGRQQPTHAGTNGFPALPYPRNASLQQPPALFSNNANAGSNASEEHTTQDTTPRRLSTQSGSHPSTSHGASRGRGFGTSRGFGAGGLRGVATRGGLTRRQEFNLNRMVELANGTAVQTAPPVQALLNRNAPLVQNGPIPNVLALAGDLRQEFGGSDLSRPGPFFTRNAATGAGAAGSNAVQAASFNQGGNIPGSNAVAGENAEDSEDAGDQDETIEDVEAEEKNASDKAPENNQWERFR